MAKQVDEAQAAIEAFHKKALDMAKSVTDDGKAISTMINAVRKSATKLREQINLAAACCVVHLIQHGNSTPANQLVDAVGPHLRNPLRAWFLGFGPFVYESRDEAKGRMLYLNKNRLDTYKDEYKADKLKFTSNLMANPFEEFTREAEFRPLDFTRALEAVVQRGRKIADGSMKVGDRTITEAEKAKCDLTGLAEAEKLLAFIKNEGKEPANDNDEAAEATTATVSA